jgi:hypothetical protein
MQATVAMKVNELIVITVTPSISWRGKGCKGGGKGAIKVRFTIDFTVRNIQYKHICSELDLLPVIDWCAMW